jgi:hypothetical protein
VFEEKKIDGSCASHRNVDHNVALIPPTAAHGSRRRARFPPVAQPAQPDDHAATVETSSGRQQALPPPRVAEWLDRLPDRRDQTALGGRSHTADKTPPSDDAHSTE